MKALLTIAAALLLAYAPRAVQVLNEPFRCAEIVNRLNEQGENMTNVELATRVAWSFIGTAYRWGGDDPMAGFDCSGFVIEILKSVGKLPRVGDWSAAQLSEMFPKTTVPHEGCLVFYSSTPGGHIIHVEYVIDDTRSIGASGGGSSTNTVQDAINQDAYIKVRPFGGRQNIACFVNPFI